MARTINKLSAAFVAKVTKPGMYGDGGGLWLQVAKSTSRDAVGTDVTKSWIFRFMLAGKSRYMGLGDLNTFSLAEARERARLARQKVADGIDPIEERRAQLAARRAEDARRVTFKQAAGRYIDAHRVGWKNAKHAEQWTNTLETYAYPVIGDLDVAQVDISHVMKVLEPIWEKKTETASRVRGRIERVLDWAKARHYRDGENPARWKGHLDKLLPARSKVAKVKHQPAMAYAELPGFMATLRGLDSVSARALEFTILTAKRTGEVIGAKWHEFDLDAKLWTIPGERMKAGKEHRVPLSDRCVEILEGLAREAGNDFVFIGARKGAGLSSMAMLELLRGHHAGLTVHGFRSTFSDWHADTTNYQTEVKEAALAHVISEGQRAAYERGDKLEKRRRLMRDWAAYCAKPAADGGTVLPMQRRRAS